MTGPRRRAAVDVGGTFTDLVIEEEGSPRRFYKRSTTPDDPVRGLLDVFQAAADDVGLARRELFADISELVHGTTRATNAVVTLTTAPTAYLCTAGHADTLLWREGNDRRPPMDYEQLYPEPYVPRALTFQIAERITSDGSVRIPLDEEQVIGLLRSVADSGVEAIGVCLLWSIVNPDHERAVGRLIAEHVPGIPYTLSYELNPSIREYRRASSTVIDASIKPLMSRYFAHLETSLRDEGFAGRLLSLSSNGGVLDIADVAKAPIHSIGSGPAAAPVAGRHFARRDAGAEIAIVTDAGGTTYDVSVVRGDQIPWTRETVIGEGPGYMLGFPSVDVRSIGAGGGSIASIDDSGLLQVGPQSAGAHPGPACYGRGGTRPTVTDACLVLGHIDPEWFLGGSMKLESARAHQALAVQIAEPLALSLDEAAQAVLTLAVEHMVTAIEEITLRQGIDPRAAVLVGGGGGAGLYSIPIARRLGVPYTLIPEVAAALSATGALISELRQSFAALHYTTSSMFDIDGVNALLTDLGQRCARFIEQAGGDIERSDVELAVEGRYSDQVWEIETPLTTGHFEGVDDVEALRRQFDATHESLFAHYDAQSDVEFISWRATARCHVRERTVLRMQESSGPLAPVTKREVFFADRGRRLTDVWRLAAMPVRRPVEGPAIIEAPATSVVLYPGSSAERLESGSLLVTDAGSPEETLSGSRGADRSQGSAARSRLR